MTISYFPLSSGSLRQDWSNTSLIAANDDWSAVPSIVGYSLVTPAAEFPIESFRIGLTAASLAINGTVTANQDGPASLSPVLGLIVAEFDGLPDPVVALGSVRSNMAILNFFLDATGRQSLTVSYTLRDIDGSSNDARIPSVLQYRFGDSGLFVTVPSATVDDATAGPFLEGLETKVTAVLPAEVDGFSQLQVRVLLHGPAGAHEWVGIDDIEISSAAAATAGNDSIEGGAAADSLTGGDGTDWIAGGAGNDSLDGGSGNDTLEGGLGDDIYWVDGGDKVVEAPGEGTDTVHSSLESTRLAANVENLILDGGAIRLKGNALDNLLVGNALDNRLRGNAGDDTLVGGAGDDTLQGGTGADVFVIASGSGHDRIQDMRIEDTLSIVSDVNGSGIVDMATFVSRATFQKQGALMDLGGGNDVLLVGVHSSAALAALHVDFV